MTQYDERVELQRLKIEAEEWASKVKTIHGHSISSMHYDTRPQDTEDGKRVVDVERVQATLEHLLLEQPDASLVIQADEHAYNGTVVKVMDAAKGAGVKNIALAAEKR